jgi:hypothetical protein
MSKMTFLVTFILVALPSNLFASSPRVSHEKNLLTGAVCAGPDLSPAPDRNNLKIKVGIEKPRRFELWQWVSNGLDLEKRHLIVIYNGKTPIASWYVDFRALKTNFVIVWKAYGAWKMKPVKSEVCGMD